MVSSQVLGLEHGIGITRQGVGRFVLGLSVCVCFLARWNYRPKPTGPNGSCSWYCQATLKVEKTCVEKQYSVTDAKNESKDRASAFATTFMQVKLRVVDIAITNEGKVNAKLWECVEQIKTAGTKHFKHGKCKSLRKYLAEIGKKRSDVDAELIDSRTNAAGITK